MTQKEKREQKPVSFVFPFIPAMMSQ